MNEEQRRIWPHVTVAADEDPAPAPVPRSANGLVAATIAIVALIFAIRWVGESSHAWTPDSDLTVLAGIATVALVAAGVVALRDGDHELLKRLAIRVGGIASFGAVATLSLAIG